MNRGPGREAPRAWGGVACPGDLASPFLWRAMRWVPPSLRFEPWRRIGSWARRWAGRPLASLVRVRGFVSVP